MIDVFLRSLLNGNDMRLGMYVSCMAWWRKQPDINLNVLAAGSDFDKFTDNDKHAFLLREDNFHIRSKQMAERLSTSDIYVVADDDCLPVSDDFIGKGLRCMESFSLYGLLTGISCSDGNYSLQGAPAVPIDMHSVGGIAFVRKGILTELAPCDPDKVDDTICSEITKKGYRTGVMPQCVFNHLGAFHSITGRGLHG